MSIKDWPCWAKVGLTVGLVVFALNWPSSSVEWAAWVQAFGSIGAVAAAIYIMNRQVTAQRELRSIEKKEALTSAVQLIERAGRHITCYVNEPALKDSRMRDIADPLKVWADVFSSLDITSPALQGVAIYVANIRLQIAVVQSILLAIESKKTTFEDQKESLDVSCNSIKSNADSCLNVLHGHR